MKYLEYLNENWYHGSYDNREIEKNKKFSKKSITVDYINDLQGYYSLQSKLKDYRENDMDLYHKALDEMGNFKDEYTYPKPLFVTDKLSVARTYADGRRAFDYQNSIPHVYEVDVNCDKKVEINAYGDRFRFIKVEQVRDGFIRAGIKEEEIDKAISMFNYYTTKGIKTDLIAAIGNWFEFDCIDVKGVLDSYHGGSIKSTVRMILNPENVNIK